MCGHVWTLPTHVLRRVIPLQQTSGAISPAQDRWNTLHSVSAPRAFCAAQGTSTASSEAAMKSVCHLRIIQKPRNPHYPAGSFSSCFEYDKPLFWPIANINPTYLPALAGLQEGRCDSLLLNVTFYKEQPLSLLDFLGKCIASPGLLGILLMSYHEQSKRQITHCSSVVYG